MGSRPTKLVFLFSFFVGLYAILSTYISQIRWDFLSSIGITNWVLLMVAFILLLAGVIFKGL